MKKIYTVFLALTLTLIFSSCEKEKPLNELIIGMWEVQSVRIVNYENDIKKTEITYFLEADEMALQFAEGGTGISYENGEVLGMFSWSLSGNILTMGDDMEMNVSIDGNTLTWSYTETEEVENVDYKYEFYYTAFKSE
ncbi:MAG: hypothetical protein JXR66_01745 [Bacteroidales bacterium]|nr:hypothetical protein [Bacteroidales bacterium]MBN2632248.1 hypothetical protein [Bacteroidales bacterium]